MHQVLDYDHILGGGGHNSTHTGVFSLDSPLLERDQLTSQSPPLASLIMLWIPDNSPRVTYHVLSCLMLPSSSMS